MFVHSETVRVTVKKLKRDYRFLHISDAHVAVALPDAPEEDKAFAEKQARR